MVRFPPSSNNNISYNTYQSAEFLNSTNLYNSEQILPSDNYPLFLQSIVNEFNTPISYEPSNNPKAYDGELQRIYNYGKENQNEPLTPTLASQAIKSLGIDFGAYEGILTQAITGMTGIEAYLYLLEVLKAIDTKDGQTDREINTPTNNFKDAFATAGLGNTQRKIENSLLDSAQEFKENDDPQDQFNIEFLRSTTQISIHGDNPADFLSEGGKAAAQQIGDFTDKLGVTDPTLGNQQKILELVNNVLDLLSNFLPNIFGSRGIFSGLLNNIFKQNPTDADTVAQKDKALSDLWNGNPPRIYDGRYVAPLSETIIDDIVEGRSSFSKYAPKTNPATTSFAEQIRVELKERVTDGNLSEQQAFDIYRKNIQNLRDSGNTIPVPSWNSETKARTFPPAALR